MNQPLLAASPYEPPLRQATQPLHHLGTLYAGRWLIIGSTTICLLAGLGYALFTRSVYRSDILIQVEPTPNLARQNPNESGMMIEPKPDATAEIQVLQSRLVVSRAVDNLKLFIEAAPRYVPVVGWWLAGRADAISRPLPGGYVYGAETIVVDDFRVPPAWFSKPFLLTLGANETFTLVQSKPWGGESLRLMGKIGQPLHAETPRGTIDLLVRSATGAPGASFALQRNSEGSTTEWLQRSLAIAERGKQSNIIGVTLDGTDPLQGSRILDEIGKAYVQQNVYRRSEEADKSIRFLDEQLPQLKKQLEASESRFNAFRASHGTVDTSQEGTTLLQQSVDAQARLQDLRQKREELITRYTEKHPAVLAIDGQLRDAQAVLAGIAARTRELPLLEQNVLQLQRDMKVDTELYTNRLNARQQLILVRAGKVGNVRMIDSATPPETPVKPRRGVAVAGSAAGGLMLGLVLAVLRRRMGGAVQDRQEIENATGLTVYATVPRSRAALDMNLNLNRERAARLRNGPPRRGTAPAGIPAHDAAIESLRSFRTTLQFTLNDAPNRVVLITGPTAGIGKSFVSLNLATLAGSSNRRVLLIDADLRKGRLHQHFGLERMFGLSDVIEGASHFDDVVRRDVSPNLDFLPTGAISANPSELLLHPNLGPVLESIAGRYDMVVVDGPPLLLVADALVLGRMAGTVFLVARHGLTTLAEIDESARRLAQADVTIRGVVFNDFKGVTRRYHYAYGSYGIGGDAGGGDGDGGLGYPIKPGTGTRAAMPGRG